MSLPCRYYEELLFRKLIDVVGRSRCDCIALSGGIDTSVILLASIKAGVKPKAITVMYREGIPKDLPYVIHISKSFNVNLDLVVLDSNDVLSIKDGVISCIGRDELDSHGDGGCIEFRNDAVFYAVMSRAKECGCRCIYVGSGGDELFLGYSFLQSLRSDELEGFARRALHGRFPELRIGRCLGVNVVAPYLTNDVIDVVLNIPPTCLRSERLLGKEVLRNILELYGLDMIAWRRKTPAEEGAGTKDVCLSVYDL